MDEVELMARIAVAWRRRAAAALRPFGITLPQYRLIRLARRRGATSPSAAAAELDLDRPTATLVARKCVAAGWLARGRSGQDRRSARLELSGAGEELLDRIESARALGRDSLGEALDVLGVGERAELARMLDRVHRRARDVWAGGPAL